MSEFSDLVDSLQTTADIINARFSEASRVDFSVLSFKDDILTIEACTDMLLSRRCEIEFSSVEFFDGPMRWASTPCAKLVDVLPLSNELFAARRYGLSIALATSNSRRVIIASASIKINFERALLSGIKKEL